MVKTTTSVLLISFLSTNLNNDSQAEHVFQAGQGQLKKTTMASAYIKQLKLSASSDIESKHNFRYDYEIVHKYFNP